MRIDGGLISAHLWRVSTVFAALSVAPEFRNTRVYARASLKSHGRWWPIAADRYGEYALLLAFLQAPARSVRRRVLQSSCQPPNLVAGRRLEFRNTRAYARASLKSHRRWLAHRDSRRDRAANRLDHVTLTPGAAALAVATDTLWVPLRAQSQPRPTAPDGRPAQVVDVTLRPRFDPLANYAKLGDGVGAIARVAIWTGINIDWSKRTGRLPRALV